MLTEKIQLWHECDHVIHSTFFGLAVKSEPVEKLIQEGKTGSILGTFDINKVYESNKY